MLKQRTDSQVARMSTNPHPDLIDTGVGSASTVGQWVSLPNGTWAEIVSIPNSNTVRVNGDRTEIVAPTDPYVISKLPYTNLAYSTAGQWTGESFASSETTLTDSSATFASYMVGWQVILDMEFPVAQLITAVPSATTLSVAGDVRTLTDPGKFYILFAPPKVDAATGTLADIITEGEEDDWDVLTSSLYLWAGYRYVPPMVGYYKISNGTTVGAQAGNNKLGNYHCNNRVYSIGHGRWLSPDQAANPYNNLFDYVANCPVQLNDPLGLFGLGPAHLVRMRRLAAAKRNAMPTGGATIKTDCGELIASPVGTHENGFPVEEKSERITRGASIHIHFHKDPKCNCNCEDFDFVQVISGNVPAQSGPNLGKTEHIDTAREGVPYYGKSGAAVGRSFHKGPMKGGYRKSADKAGEKRDCLASSPEVFSTASFYDDPEEPDSVLRRAFGAGNEKDMSLNFETCLVCINKDGGKDKILGCFKWSFTRKYDNNGGTWGSAQVSGPTGNGEPSADFKRIADADGYKSGVNWE
jgi:RHS repeat-associated protein